VLSKGSSVSLLIRYKRIMRHVEPLIESLGIEKGTKSDNYMCIGSNNMGIDKKIFWAALNGNTSV